MKTKIKFLCGMVMVMIVGLCVAPAVQAADFVTQGVTLDVPAVLSIEASVADISLDFADYTSGSASSTQDVTYTVSCNNMLQSDGSVALKAKLDGLFTDIDFKADPGTYSKTGGDTELVEATSGYITIGTTDTTLANKGNSTGDGKVLNGSMSVTYMATATADLAAGTLDTQYLDVVLVNV